MRNDSDETESTQCSDRDRNAIEAVIRGANRVWLLVFLLPAPVVVYFIEPFLVAGLAQIVSLLAACYFPYFVFRYLHWISLRQQHQVLWRQDESNEKLGSRFRASRWKLIAGMVLGAIGIFSVSLIYLNIMSSRIGYG